MISDIDMVTEGVSRKVFDTPLFDSAGEPGGYLFDTSTEQTPNPDSRVTLSEQRDALGLRRVRLDWRLQRRDRENLWRCYRILAAELGRIQLGRVRLRFEKDDSDRLFDDLLSGFIHHIGTTRAHRDPKLGVVDENLKVHGLINLYVAGSSVFPTSGHVPPTLTIVALAVRLADHIERVARRRL